MDYARQTRFSDPRAHAKLFDPLPDDPRGIGEVIRNIVVHYRASGIPFELERLAEIDSRWADRLLDADRSRFDTPLTEPRAPEQRIVGCCRDFTLLTVAALRHKGIPARSRVGFADYLGPDWHYDHVVAEYWDGARWTAIDSQVDRYVDLAPGGLRTAAQVWSEHRRGDLDVESFGVDPGDHFNRGSWFVRNYVISELAHRRGDELLLWDLWGGMYLTLGYDLEMIDEVADLLQSADAGDSRAEEKLAGIYADDERLHPGVQVECLSPSKPSLSVFTVDLERRQQVESRESIRRR
ncbi:transglutaminase domain-containing protein [Actinoplanes sp. KI2]|uniref:transglutaminase domain-containing protein n=1 Tax=Actinoplanes sp. KI2 TaxID=2983315 RepID=UPI0021D5BB91|nr:transglutaminase domain-containing protein [Actinoplanes sp. KI2]MCU7725869.1 transglutaminase domain-containing protein [Actinoplanes sp. KI2]